MRIPSLNLTPSITSPSRLKPRIFNHQWVSDADLSIQGIIAIHGCAVERVYCRDEIAHCIIPIAGYSPCCINYCNPTIAIAVLIKPCEMIEANLFSISTMAKNNSDQFAKQLLEEILAPFGTVETSHEVPGEPQWVDVFFVPTHPSMTSELGLLGRIAQQSCLIEPFRNQPTDDEVRSCLLKLYQVHGNFLRQSRREEGATPTDNLPFLWILTSSASERLLQEFGAIAHEDWPPGVYFLPPGFKAAIVSINQLPQNDETLLLRLLGKGRTQNGAIAEVLSFDIEDPRRSSILRLLLNWRISVEVTREFEAQEEELLMALSQAYLEWEQQTEQRGRQSGIQEGKQIGIQEGLEHEKSLILRQLTRRIGPLAPDQQTQIRNLSLLQLEELGEALLDFSQASDLEAWLNARS
jgi:Domain of unknown function (DUF4351)